MQEITHALQRSILELFKLDVQPELSRTDEQFGDYATNVALQLAGRLQSSPRDIAAQLVERLETVLGNRVKAVSIAGPGFINITLTDDAIVSQAKQATVVRPTQYQGQTVVAEYSDPNPFKVLHAGHLYTSVVGDAVANLIAVAGGDVHRVNFGGDVGLHVGKTLWAIVQKLGGEHPEKLADIAADKRAEWMAECYIYGTAAYDDDPAAKAAIVELNKQVYRIQDEADHDSPLAQLYWTCRTWSYEYFDSFYAHIGTKFEKYYPESDCAAIGLATVKEQFAKGVFKESGGAVVFEGEPYGLHTRVFINSQGLPTYEAKDIGLIMLKKRDYNFDRSVVITGNEQDQYMAVVLKSIEQFAPELVEQTTHFTHGMVKLAGGVKMSSRKGNILRAIDVLEAAGQANRQATGRDDQQAVLGAVKYAFLKSRIGADIIYDPVESVSLLGNSGPYLQYAHARARSIMAKAPDAPVVVPDGLESGERSLARKIGEYPDVVHKAVQELLPHHICTYLYELAQAFNRFYEHNRVIGDSRQAERLALVGWYADTLKDGLTLLGIAAPEHL